jgi:hypothetical protein
MAVMAILLGVSMIGNDISLLASAVKPVREKCRRSLSPELFTEQNRAHVRALNAGSTSGHRRAGAERTLCPLTAVLTRA